MLKNNKISREGGKKGQFRWGGRRGSNPRPPESQSGALPTELRPPSEPGSGISPSPDAADYKESRSACKYEIVFLREKLCIFRLLARSGYKASVFVFA